VREPGRFREESWLVNVWSISLCSDLFWKSPAVRAADNNTGYTYFQKHLRLISLSMHSWQLSLLHGNVCGVTVILNAEMGRNKLLMMLIPSLIVLNLFPKC